MKRTFNSIEALRIVAALVVVFAHSNSFSIPFIDRFLGANLFLGSIGVDIFFVVSGYVMYLSAKESSSGTAGATKFLINRFFRIFPLYILATLALVLHTQVTTEQTFEWDIFLKSIFLLPIHDNGYIDPIIGIGWTLRFELFFYLLVAFGIFINKKILFPTLTIFISIAACHFFNFYYGAPIILEFLAGYLVCYCLLKNKFAPPSYMFNLAGFVFSIFLMFIVALGKDWGYETGGIYRMWIMYEHAPAFFRFVPRFIAWGIPSLLLTYFSIHLENNFKWRIAKFGKYTYSIYLIQVFTNP